MADMFMKKPTKPSEYWLVPLRIRPCLCGHDEFDHSQILFGEPCLDCDCPGFMWAYRPDPIDPEDQRNLESLL